MNDTSFKYGIQSDHTLRWYLLQHSASILHVGPQRHQNPIHFEWSAHECTSLPKPACAFIITWTKVNLSGFIPSCCICWKKLRHCLLILLILHLFDAKMFNCMVPGAIGTISGFISPQARVIPMSSYVWHLGTSCLSTTRILNQADQPGILHIPGINGVIWTENATLTFLISSSHCHFQLTFRDHLIFNAIHNLVTRALYMM
jgi:hypothetical protein